MADKKYIEQRLESGRKYPFDAPDAWWDDESDDKEPPPPKDWAHRAARGVMADLGDRRGIKQEMREIDEDVRAELIETLADIIRHASKS